MPGLIRFRDLAVVSVVGLGIAACGDTHGPPPLACGTLQTGRVASYTQCGSGLEFTPINQYQGEIASVQDREDAVALINGTCTGTLIAAGAGPVVLTAGHCLGLGDQALVAFNVEDQPDGDTLVTNGTAFEVSTEPDYALLRLDALPAVVPTQLSSRASDLVAIIQHPRGRPKVIAEGTFLGDCNGVISYADLDTLVGSSGAGVLSREGYLFGVHSDGNCAEDGSGANNGWSAARIVDASAYLQPADIADR